MFGRCPEEGKKTLHLFAFAFKRSCTGCNSPPPPYRDLRQRWNNKLQLILVKMLLNSGILVQCCTVGDLKKSGMRVEGAIIYTITIFRRKFKLLLRRVKSSAPVILLMMLPKILTNLSPSLTFPLFEPFFKN